MRSVTLLTTLLFILVACSNDSSEDTETSSDENIIETQAVTVDQEGDNLKTEEPIDFEKAVEKWGEEIEKWLTSGGVGAIEVNPMNDDYTDLQVIIHDNFKSLDEIGRKQVVNEMTNDLNELSKEIFNHNEEVQVVFELRDGSLFYPMEDQAKEIPKPMNEEQTVEIWHEEVENLLASSGMGAIEVTPVEDDYSHLKVLMHNNFKEVAEDEKGRNFIAEDIKSDLQELVDEIFNYDEEIQVEFEFQDGSPLFPNE